LTPVLHVREVLPEQSALVYPESRAFGLDPWYSVEALEYPEAAWAWPVLRDPVYRARARSVDRV